MTKWHIASIATGLVLFAVVAIIPGDQPIPAFVSGYFIGWPIGQWLGVKLADRFIG